MRKINVLAVLFDEYRVREQNFCERCGEFGGIGRKKTMNKDKKLCVLLVPLIFVILLFVPGMILDITPNTYIQGMPDVIWGLFLVILWSSVIIWTILFYYIPIGVYIAMLVVYTVVSWMWIFRQKKGNVMYAIVWLVLCVLSILMYWKWWWLYHGMVNG